jgi:ribosomal protein L44E
VKLKRIEVTKENKREICTFCMTGQSITEAQVEYLNGSATVNLMDFRRSYMRLHSLVGNVRKQYAKGLPVGRQEGVQ